MSDWIRLDERKPEEGQEVIYYFDMVGVHRGFYVTETDEEGYVHDIFYGKSGFLTDDVTHWMPDTGQELPAKPE